jgi:hypothetical protein
MATLCAHGYEPLGSMKIVGYSLKSSVTNDFSKRVVHHGVIYGVTTKETNKRNEGERIFIEQYVFSSEISHCHGARKSITVTTKARRFTTC